MGYFTDKSEEGAFYVKTKNSSPFACKDVLYKLLFFILCIRSMETYRSRLEVGHEGSARSCHSVEAMVEAIPSQYRSFTTATTCIVVALPRHHKIIQYTVAQKQQRYYSSVVMQHLGGQEAASLL